MSSSGSSLAERIGLKKFLHDIRHQRRRFRQFVGIAFVILLTIVGEPKAAWFWPGVAAALAGIAVRLWASGHVKKDKELAVTGPYAFVRHPLYVGNHLISLGFCLASGHWWSFPVWIALGLYFYPQTIRDEDRLLARLFPDQWASWAREVRALIPRLKPYRAGGGSAAAAWSFAVSLRRNGEPLIAALLLLFLYLLYLRLP
jgi:protein-S-isoprenylcysteine O-methyltransferase Ste14